MISPTTLVASVGASVLHDANPTEPFRESKDEALGMMAADRERSVRILHNTLRDAACIRDDLVPRPWPPVPRQPAHLGGAWPALARWSDGHSDRHGQIVAHVSSRVSVRSEGCA